jgi:CRISPR/Cas system-associated protein Cas7 (RAMP superfamily)
MWSTSVSSEAERIRNYFIDMSLKEHDVAYVMSMHDVIEEISEDLSFELKKKNISLSSDANGQQEELNRVMEAYEDRFFERMGEELEKIRGRGF